MSSNLIVTYYVGYVWVYDIPPYWVDGLFQAKSRQKLVKKNK